MCLDYISIIIVALLPMIFTRLCFSSSPPEKKMLCLLLIFVSPMLSTYRIAYNQYLLHSLRIWRLDLQPRWDPEGSESGIRRKRRDSCHISMAALRNFNQPVSISQPRGWCPRNDSTFRHSDKHFHICYLIQFSLIYTVYLLVTCSQSFLWGPI